MPGRILAIDDNQDILDLFRDLLSAESYEVIVSDFIEPGEIARIQPDVLILDNMAGSLPVGGQLIRRLKQQPTTQDLPVIVCTTSSMASAEQEPAFHLDGVGLVLKPFDVDDLLHSIERALAQPHLTASGANN